VVILLPNLVELIKRAAVEAVNEAKPTSIVFGQVTSIDPLKIAIDQKLILTSTQLILTNNVRDYDLEMTVDHTTENSSGGSGDSSFASHNHAYSGKKTFRVHNGLILGDEVIMIQVQGGQKFIVVEKVVKA
jgi:hypothetical protein